METHTVTTVHLTPRERQIIRRVAQGLGNRQIASELGVSEQTVKNQLCTLYQKIGIDRRVQLAVYAMRRGLADGAPSDMVHAIDGR